MFKNTIDCFQKFRNVINTLSDIKKLRNTRRFGNVIKSEWDNKCAICGRENPDVAHIIPAEEGGEGSKDNLLPLCRRSRTSLITAPGKVNLVGCHQLLDNEGVWSRDLIRYLKKAGPNNRNTVKIERPQPTLLLNDFYREKQKVEFLIAKSQKKKASDMLKALREKYKDSPDETWDVLLKQLRCERRRLPAREAERNLEKIGREIDFLYESCNDPATLEVIDYERGMMLFEKREFTEAAQKLRFYITRTLSRRGGWVINEAQAYVADFENAREENLPKKEIEKVIEGLNQIVTKLDNFTSNNSDIIFHTWRVTARLHLARIKAYINYRDAMSWVKEAEKIRDAQDKETGWKRYTRILLLYAKGECYRIEKNMKQAIQELALAARAIIGEKYKSYEYLDNVLESLLKMPKGTCEYLDNNREVLEGVRQGTIRSHFP